MLGLGGRRVAVAGAWALTSGIGPLETARTALFIAPGGAESWPESSPEESLCDCGFAVQLEGVPGLARREGGGGRREDLALVLC